MSGRSPRESHSQAIANILNHSIAPLTAERERELFLRWRDHGDRKAGDQIARAVQRYLAQRAQFFARRSGTPIDDLFAWANQGLFRAMQSFEPEKGFRLITYANAWIDRYIADGIAFESAPFSARSNHGTKLAHELRNEAVRIHEAPDREAAVEQLRATHRQVARLSRRTLEHILLLARNGKPASLDAARADGRDWHELLAADGEAPDDQVHRQRTVANLHVRIENAIATLAPRERQMIRGTVYCDPEDALTCAAMGRLFGVSRERARQIQALAVKKLRLALSLDGGPGLDL
jgi:RNA polymerase sigma-32 factor